MKHLAFKLALAIFAVIAVLGKSFAYPEYWQHRSVIMFAPSKDDLVQRFITQTHMHDCQLDERRIMTLVVTNDGHQYPNSHLKPSYVQQLAQQFSIDTDDHTILLLGLDGEEKHRWNGQVNWNELTEIVDSMPIRQQEMLAQSSPCSA